jgi:hypothetical protein
MHLQDITLQVCMLQGLRKIYLAAHPDELSLFFAVTISGWSLGRVIHQL